MRSHRLSRLAHLTRGVALVGFGLSELACAGDPPPATPINAPPPAAPREVNAPDESARDAAAPPAASTAPPPADVGPPSPDHVNSPSPTVRVAPSPSVPKRVNSPGPQAPPKP